MITSAVFFDGVSSVPQKIDIYLDEISGELVFLLPGFIQHKWAVDKAEFDFSGPALNIRFGTNPIQSIKIDHTDFISNLKAYLKNNDHLSWYQKIMNLGFKAYLALALIILGLIVLIYLVVIPWVGENAALLIPQEYDNKIGNSFFDEYSKYNTVDSGKTAILNLFAKQLNLENSKPIHFTVIKSNTVNAFALPDGNIIIFTAIIDSMVNYDELAGLIMHEVVHVNNRHSMKMMCRNLSGYIFISAVLSDVNGIMAVIGDNINNLQSLSYSRQFEREADEEGLDLLILNGINPNGMIGIFNRLHSNAEKLMPAFLSSHPITTDRIDYLKKLISKSNYTVKKNPRLEILFNEIKVQPSHDLK